MTDQWFLDLDGTRSGPYHTPEIMTLIAEGEVLPHHRISTGLKDQTWVTILDWRLDQAKLTQTTSPRPGRTEGFNSDFTPIRHSSHEKLNSADASPLMELADWTPEDITQTDLPDAKTSAAAEVEIPAPQNSAPKIKATPSAPNIASDLGTTGEPSPAPNAKRDPMAEMFDMLQNSKQKKDSRANTPLPTGVSIESDTSDSKKIGRLAKTLGIGIGIVFIGFALGQLFQSTSPPPAAVEANVPLAKPNVEPSVAPAPHAKSELVDRSTDKLTIRANVERHLEVAPSPPPSTKTSAKSLGHATSAEIMQNEKELEELKSLKKELQELKNLKSNSNTPDDLPEPEGDGFDAGSPESGMNGDPNGVMQNSYSNPPGVMGGAQTAPDLPPSH